MKDQTTARRTLQGLRDWATRTENLDMLIDIGLQQQPEQASDLLQKAVMSQAKRVLGPALLELERNFIEAGWRLPQWQRPTWLSEVVQ